MREQAEMKTKGAMSRAIVYCGNGLFTLVFCSLED